MSISTALGNAVTGLTAASRSAQIVSNNVSNAMTDGYGVQVVQLSSRSLAGSGAGVSVDGVIRTVDPGLLQDRRFADAALGYASDQTDTLGKLFDLIGQPDDDASLAGRVRALEAALLQAGSRPDSEPRLSAILTAATDLAGTLNDASDGVQEARLAADADIARQVNRVNDALIRLQELNAEISRGTGSARDVSALLDQRQVLIDSISEIVPVREVPRQDGRVSLYTEGGGVLYDDTPRLLSFSPVNLITPDMTLASGALSNVSMDGRVMATSGSYAPLGGGTLAQAFERRDGLGVVAQERLDSLARDLVERFADPAVDPTLLPGDPGLFTDRGAAFNPLDEVGLAQRLSVNALVDPAQGGAIWRLRDGLGAAAPGNSGDATLIYAMSDALTVARTPSSGAIATTARSAIGLVGDLTSLAASDLATAEARQAVASARQGALREQELLNGVDTDQEMQKLLLIEQAYAANARVIQTIDGMIRNLLEI